MSVYLTRFAKGAAICGLTLAFGLFTAVSASAQGTKAAKKSFENRTLTTKDNVSLKCTYFPSPEISKETPVVVLLHGKGGNRLVWQTGAGQYPGFAQALQQKGYAVLTVDLRHHGENLSSGEGATPANKKADQIKLKPADYQAMVAFDMEAVKKFLMEEHQKEKLNIGKLAIIGADFTTAIALAYTELDWAKEPYDDAPTAAQRTPRGQDVKALVLLSPETTVPGLKTNGGTALIKQLKMNVMLGVGSKDTLDKGTARKLADQLDPTRDTKDKDAADKVPYVFLETYETKFRGTDLLVKEGLKVEAQMLKFLDDHLRKLEVPWRTRKSNLVD